MPFISVTRLRVKSLFFLFSFMRANEASYHYWVQEENECPNWTTISDKLYSEGKLSKVRNPSNAQITNQFPPIQWTKSERRLK